MKGEVHSHLEENIRPYIDLIDTLRSVGIQKDLALPTIVVIGDQSSGKSSVLEALSGVALPRGSGEDCFFFLLSFVISAIAPVLHCKRELHVSKTVAANTVVHPHQQVFCATISYAEITK